MNGALVLFGGSEGNSPASEPELPAGRYLVKAYLDKENKVATQPTLILSGKDYVGSTILPNAQWRVGFKHAEVVRGRALQLETDEE